MSVELVVHQLSEVRVGFPMSAERGLLYEVGVLELLEHLEAGGVSDVAEVLGITKVL
jgi:hypothetical protein